MSNRPTEKEIRHVPELNGLPMLPNASRAEFAGNVLNDGPVISGVGAFNNKELPRSKRKLVDRVRYLARFDHLTGLHCRMALREKLAKSAGIAEAQGNPVALILLDLDDFANVNDTQGQDAGDVCLRGVAHRLIEVVGTAGFVASMGGDEFAILLQGQTRRSLEDIVERIKKSIAIPVSFEEHTFQLTSSIGIAVRCDGRRFKADALIRDATLALREAKAAGKNCHRTFRRVLLASCNDKLDTLRDVRCALARRQLELYYQPKVSLRDRAHAGFEALIRCKKDGQVLSPGSFMAAFEDPSLSVEIGNYVIGSAIDQARRWMIADVPFDSIAINLSASQFRDPGLADRVLTAIAAAGLYARMIEVEVTEGVFLSASSDAVRNVCKALKQGGVRIAFDDFGTGFASLTHLRDFPVDIIKIDRSFISQLGQSQSTTVIVNAMVGLAHNLSMSTVAEGVETQAQADFLKTIGCDAAQGYLFGRPVPAAVATEQLEEAHKLLHFA
jgi:diguanylate cyclase (GGDEF)-like protein